MDLKGLMMTAKHVAFFSSLVLAASLCAGQASAGDDRFAFDGSIGMMNIDAGEFIFNGPVQISRLDWITRGAMTLNVGGTVKLGDVWSLKANATTAFSGNSDMTDRDWLYSQDWKHGIENAPNGPGDWTHIS